MSRETAEHLVRQAARAAARGGLVNVYGHCSVQLDERSFPVCAAKPMRLIMPSGPGTVVLIDAQPAARRRLVASASKYWPGSIRIHPSP